MIHRCRTLAALALGGLACGAEQAASPPEPPAPAAAMRAETSGIERAGILGPFLDRHWQLPIPAQGPAPPSFSEPEASLDPAACGSCHPKQYAEWQTSLHAGAFSPGLAGQLIEGGLALPAEVRRCQACHAPLAEQQPFGDSLAPNPDLIPELRTRGVVCASCHVRGRRTYGPPRRPETPPAPEPVPHAGFEVRPEFQESRFCTPCHQFFDDPGIGGKPLENTYIEWEQSPHAAQGRTCQSCHMPDRAHLWRGIHDPETVRAAVDVDLVLRDASGGSVRAALMLHNRDVGHAFPSYVTPRVLLAVWQVDRAHRELEGSRLEATIGREVDFARSIELFDTRVAPGDTVKLDYAVERRPEAATLVGRITVDPDHHYRGVFGVLRRRYRSPEARAQMEEAYRRTTESIFVLSEIRLPLPEPSG